MKSSTLRRAGIVAKMKKSSYSLENFVKYPLGRPKSLDDRKIVTG
jgi:hypothetical protein